MLRLVGSAYGHTRHRVLVKNVGIEQSIEYWSAEEWAALEWFERPVAARELPGGGHVVIGCVSQDEREDIANVCRQYREEREMAAAEH